jgi:flagellar basal body rod protein FlgF
VRSTLRASQQGQGLLGHLPNEMVDLITASRAYEANLKALHQFRQMTEQTLALLRGA